MIDPKAIRFKPIELAWSVLLIHKEVCECSQARLMPDLEGSFQVRCPVHGLIRQDGQPAPDREGGLAGEPAQD